MAELAPRRLRRTRTNDSIENLFNSPTENKQQDNSELPVPSLHSNDDTISSIRSELLEDRYHATLAEPDYSDGSHNWSDADNSAEYWHFLGQYE